MRHPGPLGGSELDLPCIVRGAWRGFVVLLLGGLAAPLLQRIVPVVGYFSLTLVAVVAFTLAACGVGRRGHPVRHGVYAAVGAYALVLPIVLLTPAGRDLVQISLTAALAVAIGAGTGFLAGRTGSETTGSSTAPYR